MPTEYRQPLMDKALMLATTLQGEEKELLAESGKVIADNKNLDLFQLPSNYLTSWRGNMDAVSYLRNNNYQYLTTQDKLALAVFAYIYKLYAPNAGDDADIDFTRAYMQFQVILSWYNVIAKNQTEKKKIAPLYIFHVHTYKSTIDTLSQTKADYQHPKQTN